MAKKPARGLLIDDKLIEIVAVELKAGRFAVMSYAWAPLAEGIIKGGRVFKPALLAEEIRKLWQKTSAKLRKSAVVLGLPQSQVFLKVFTLPGFEDRELEEAISWQVGTLWPELPQDAYTSYEVIEKGTNSAVKVLVVAAPKAAIDGYLETLEKAGVEVAVIEPLALAKARLIDPKQLLGKNAISVHIYAGKLAISVLVNGKLWFSKEREITATEKIGQIKTEVEELMRFFNKRKEIGTGEINAVIYGGDKSGMAWLERSLSNLSLPLVKAEGGIMVKDWEFAPVLGLAVRGQMEQKGLIDLLPSWPKERTVLKHLTKNLATAVMMVGIMIWLTVLGLETGWWQIEQKQRALLGQKERLEQELKQDDNANVAAWASQFNQTVQAAHLIENSRISYSQLLGQLASLVPKAVRLTSFSYNSLSKQWLITGVAEKREDVLGLKQALERGEFFKNARLYFSSLETSEGVVFRIVGGKNE